MNYIFRICWVHRLEEAQELYVFYEGDDDERFFDRVLENELKKLYSSIIKIKYRSLKKKIVNNFIKSAKQLKSKYIFLADIDKYPCVTARKDSLMKNFPELETKNISIVIKMIESWYLAGLKDASLDKLHIEPYKKTSEFDKGSMKKLMPKNYSSIMHFKIDVLKYFSMKAAIDRNNSFCYFLRKFVKVKDLQC